ncbi:MAG: CPBP family glutamic-type intramembrane protease [Myxococcota bacterium]
MTRARMFLAFFAIAHGGGALVACLFPEVWSMAPDEGTGPQKAVGIVHLMPVLFATLVVQGPLLKQPLLEPLGLKLGVNRWWFIACLCPVLILAVGLGVCAALGHDLIVDAADYVARKRAALPPDMRAGFDARLAESPPSSPLLFIGQGLIAGVTFNLMFTLATEVGWRGFLFREVRGGFWRRSVLIGLAEAAYFAPIALLGFHFGDPLTGLLAMTVWAVVASPVLTYLRVRADSVFAPAIFRGAILGLTAVAADLTDAGPALRPFFGAGAVVGLLVVLVLFWQHDRQASQRLMTR